MALHSFMQTWLAASLVIPSNRIDAIIPLVPILR